MKRPIIALTGICLTVAMFINIWTPDAEGTGPVSEMDENHQMRPDPYRDAHVNAVIGDESYLVKYGEMPAEVDYHTRIVTHLNYVHDILSNRNTESLDEIQKENRRKMLDELQSYTNAGNFPVNEHYEHPRPRFMDPYGNICAVGHLIAETEGIETARAINENHEYDYLFDIQDDALEAWADEYGFTRTELAMIQPMYDWNPPQDPEQDMEQFPKAFESGAIVTSAGLTGINTFLLFQSQDNPWLYGVSTMFGAGTIYMGTSDRANFSSLDLITGAAAVSTGVIGLTNWIVQKSRGNDRDGPFAVSSFVQENPSWNISVAPEPGLIESVTMRLNIRF